MKLTKQQEKDLTIERKNKNKTKEEMNMFSEKMAKLLSKKTFNG